jgi:transposase
VILLQTIPGVGPRTAETIVAYIDDPNRFARAHQVGSYFGLVPRQDASAGVNRLGQITKDGPATARKYLTEAAWQAMRRSPKVLAYFQRIQQDQPERRKKALVATAHWLVRCMWAMLRSGEVWRDAA